MYTPIIGLEIHLQLKTKSKVFCACSTSEAEPNTNVCPSCLGYPGSMPNLNREAVIQSIKMGLALNCNIAKETSWDRKSYMYPDLFKGYQISQLDFPICGEGYLDIIVRDRNNYYSKDKYIKKIGIIRAHLEEDTAKSLHENEWTLLDGNKAGFPLLEIVSAPDMHTVDEAVSYAKKIKNIARWYSISECNLDLGQMRFDANISLAIDGESIKTLPFKEWKDIKHTPIVEIKNLNSFGNLQAALEYEIERQTSEFDRTNELYVKGSKETRGWNDQLKSTYTQRKKEEADEYRFTPEPDIPVLIITDGELELLHESLGKKLEDVAHELTNAGVSEQSIDLMIEEKALWSAFQIISHGHQATSWNKISNLITNELASEILEISSNKSDLPIAELFREMKVPIDSLILNKISSVEYKEILKKHKRLSLDWTQLVKEMQSAEEVDIEGVLKKAIGENPHVVTQIKSGKDSAKMFFVGIVMKESNGKANPNDIKTLIDKLLE